MQAPRRRRIRLTGIIIAGALVLNLFMHVYVLRLVSLSLEGLDNAGVPTVEAMRFPEGTTVLSARTECASGGCWSLFTVRPPDGQAREGFEDTYLVDRGRVLGTFWDPRVISVSAEEFGGDVWVVRGDYWVGWPQ